MGLITDPYNLDLTDWQNTSDLRIIEALRETYFEVYEVPTEDRDSLEFKPDTQIYRDLKANEPFSAFALEWRSQAARRLDINENRLPRPIEGHDYTLKELVEMIKKVA